VVEWRWVGFGLVGGVTVLARGAFSGWRVGVALWPVGWSWVGGLGGAGLAGWESVVARGAV
jgi:hypothetical protein